MPVTPVVNQSNNNPAWNYIMSTATGAECDMIVNENILIEAALFVHGSLCLDNNADIRVGPVIVKGTIKLANNGSIGTSSNRIQVSVGGINRDDSTRRSSTASGGIGWSDATAQVCDDADHLRHVARRQHEPAGHREPSANGTPGTRTRCPAR